MPTAKPAAAQSLRQPLSLRELFCLTTLAAVVVALVLYREWTTEERWLLGLTLGGTLLGILVSRTCGRRGWPAGVLLGAIGAGITTQIIGTAWVEGLRDVATYEPERLPSFRIGVFVARCATVFLGAVLASITATTFHLLAWITASGEQNLFVAARRRPRVTLVALGTLAVVALCIVNFDFLMHPRAWMPRHFIAFQRPGRPLFSGVGNPEANVRLSHDGKWLAFRVLDPRLKEGQPQLLLYQLLPQPHSVELPRNDGAHFKSLPEFSCDGDRCAYLLHEEWKGAFPGRGSELHIFDLTTGEDQLLEEYARHLTWLPGSKLLLDGQQLLTNRGNGWSSEEMEESAAKYDARLGYAVYSEWRLEERQSTRLVSLQTAREILLSPENEGEETLSPNGRFGLAYNRIHDHELATVRTWDNNDDGAMLQFYTFTNSGHAVATRSDWMNGLSFLVPWLWSIPFGERLQTWLWREPICLIDPAIGKEVARTQPLWSEADDIAFSFDGSRMAVINQEGVYIYDVPAEFR